MSERPATTDPQDELFDVLDEHGNPTGQAKPRRLVHRDGDWHGALHIWIGGIDERGEPFVLFQRRSATKDTWPNALDVAVGGHIRAGETLAETVREAEEEIGLPLRLDDVVCIGRRFAVGSGPGVQEREVQEIYALRSDMPLGAYRLHPEEVDALVAPTIDDVLQLAAGAVNEIAARERMRDAEADQFIRLRKSDFAGDDWTYATAALASLRSVIFGSTPTPFTLRVD